MTPQSTANRDTKEIAHAFSTTFSNNAFYILGLPTTCSQKDIQRRAKEITARLRIDEIPNYNGDDLTVKPDRSESKVKAAVHELSQPRSRLSHHFFWLNASDSDLELLSSGQYDVLIRRWSQLSDNKISNFYNLKNLAILKTLLLFKEFDTETVKDSLSTWKSLIENKDYWKIFEESYFTEDEVGCSPTIFKEFNSERVNILSDTFSELTKHHSDPTIYKCFSDTFSTKGKKVVNDVLTPIFEKINTSAEVLEGLKVSADGVLDEDEKQTINSLVLEIERSIHEIDKLGLKEDSTVRSVRDRAANALRSVVLDIHNDLGESDYAEPLLQKAKDIAGTEGERQRISRDIRVIQGVQHHLKLLQPIFDKIKSEEFISAIDDLDKLIVQHKSDSELQETLMSKKKECVLLQAAKLKKNGMDQFNKNNFPQAAELLMSGHDILQKHISIFDLNEEIVRDKLLSAVKKNVSLMTIDNIGQIEEIRNEDVKYLSEKFDERFEGYYLVMIYDCLFYGGLAAKAKDFKGQATRKAWIEKLGGWVLLLIIYGLIKACSG